MTKLKKKESLHAIGHINDVSNKNISLYLKSPKAESQVPKVKVGNYTVNGKAKYFKKYEGKIEKLFIVTVGSTAIVDYKKNSLIIKPHKITKVPVFKNMKQFDEYMKKHGHK